MTKDFDASPLFWASGRALATTVGLGPRSGSERALEFERPRVDLREDNEKE